MSQVTVGKVVRWFPERSLKAFNTQTKQQLPRARHSISIRGRSARFHTVTDSVWPIQNRISSLFLAHRTRNTTSTCSMRRCINSNTHRPDTKHCWASLAATWAKGRTTSKFPATHLILIFVNRECALGKKHNIILRCPSWKTMTRKRNSLILFIKKLTN